MARVMAVDDDHVILGLLQVNLDMEGHEMVAAVDGREALDKVQEDRPDLILLDVMMPNVDGWQVAEQLKRDEATAGIPVVVLSARAMEADVQRGAELGVDSYVTKPFDPIDLMGLVNRLLASADGATDGAADGAVDGAVDGGPPNGGRATPGAAG